MGVRMILGTYYEIYRSIVEHTRVSIDGIAKAIGHTGRGHARSTISRHLSHMYEKEISFKPNLILGTFENSQSTAFFCRKTERKGIRSTFQKLHRDEKVNYALFLSGLCDYFVTTRDPHIDLEKYGLEIVEKSTLYTPVFTIPYGWKIHMRDALKSFVDHKFRKGVMPRDVNGILEWSDLDWKIYTLMRENARLEFTKVARKSSVYSSTVKDHFYKYILPCCAVTHYFFPKGYDFYLKAFLRIHTKYESSFVTALEKFPCTSYVYPLEDGIAADIFHENTNDLMAAIEKLEETGIIDHYLLYTPLNWFI